MTLITAANGSGKSTILDAICFALFGKPYRSINKPQLVNSINGKGCEVEVGFTTGGKVYRVVRGIKPNKFLIYVDEVAINQTPDGRDYQQILETQILKMNYTTFTQVVVMGSTNYVPFMKLKAADRRDFIENLLDIKVFSVMNEILKEKFTLARDELKTLNLELTSLEEKIELQQTFIQSKLADHESRIKKLKDELSANSDTITAKDGEIAIARRELAELKKLAERFADIRERLLDLRGMYKKIESNLDTQKNDREKYAKTDHCPTCQQKLPESTREHVLNEYDSNIQKYSDGIEKLMEKMQELNSQMTGYEDNAEAIAQQTSIVSRLSQDISGLTLLNSKITRELSELESINNSEAEHEKLTEFKDRKEALEKDRTKVNERVYYFTLIQNLLKDSGIKAKIVKQYIPVINKLINKYLSDLDFFCLFTIDENFNEVIKSRYRDEFTYESFSAGERQRIDLSMMFTWRELSRLKNSANTNLLFMDEVLDQSLDTDVIDKLIGLLYNLRDSNVFVISHREGLEDKFRNVIKLQKQNNFTVIV